MKFVYKERKKKKEIIIRYVVGEPPVRELTMLLLNSGIAVNKGVKHRRSE